MQENWFIYIYNLMSFLAFEVAKLYYKNKLLYKLNNFCNMMLHYFIRILYLIFIKFIITYILCSHTYSLEFNNLFSFKCHRLAYVFYIYSKIIYQVLSLVFFTDFLYPTLLNMNWSALEWSGDMGSKLIGFCVRICRSIDWWLLWGKLDLLHQAMIKGICGSGKWHSRWAGGPFSGSTCLKMHWDNPPKILFY